MTGTFGQDPVRRINTRQDLPNRSDTVKIAQPLTDSLLIDSVSQKKPVGDIKTSINYSAKDSIITSVDSRIVQLYGNAKIIYGEIELEADFITIDYNTQELHAVGNVDSTGRRIGFPIFKNGEEVYETRDITYNFKTGRARIKEVVTEQGDGFIHGNTVFKNERDEILSFRNSYTTCNLAEPHFRIRSRRTKAIPDDKLVSGPFNLEISGVPTPLGFPFGIFPAPRKSASGIIMPTYGEEARRGFFLRNGGYFFDISDYLKLRLTGEIYSKGSYGLSMATNYRKRYGYNGNLNLSMTKNKNTDRLEAPTSVTDFRISWSHSPESKGTGKFSATVNAATATFTQNNFLGFNYDLNSSQFDNTTRKLNSSINYSKTFKGTPFSMGLSARHNQDITTKQLDLQLPEFNVNMRSIYPFKNTAKTDLLSKFNFRYSVKGTNRITNNLGRIGEATTDSIAAFNLTTLPTLLENSRKGMRHTLPVSTSFKLLKYFNANPSFSYEELWYFERLNWGLSEDGNSAVVLDTIPGFNRVSSFSSSISVNTRIYGTYLFEKGNVQAIRHVINPAISYSYTPDFGDPKYDYYQKITLNSGQEQYKSRYDRFVYGSARLGESQSVGLSIGNTLEMKVLDTSDSTSEEKKYKKVPLLRSLSFSSSYNFVADSFNLGNISIRGNTALFDNKLNMTFGATVDPYTYVLDSVVVQPSGTKRVYDRKLSDYAWTTGNGLGQISRANLSLSTSFNPRQREKDQQTAEKIVNSNLSEADKSFLLNNPDSYVDFDIPWNLRLNYNLTYGKTGFDDPRITQTVSFSGDVSLSQKWKVGLRSGYDIQGKEFLNTNITISRDLHCWEMNLNWTPFGRFTNYNFVIRVKSSLLQDLKINRKRSFFDR